MIKEEQLLEQRELRDGLVARVDVLEKVKSLLLLPDIGMATTNQVADYYEVSDRWIKGLLKSNREEFVEDGYRIWKAEDFNSEESFPIKNLLISKGKFTIEFSNDQLETFSPRGVALFPRRAILRIGMLLQDSEVAKRVRTALLDIEGKTSVETKIQDINEEQKLQLEIGMAYGSGNPDTIMLSTAKYMDFKNRHIKLQEQHIEKLKQDNKALTGEILTWKDRNKMSYAIRRLSTMLHKPFGTVWNDLYKNLYYQYSISVKARGGTPYVQHIKENEWDKVIKTFSAMCEQNNISPSEILNDANKYDGGIN